MPRKTMKTADAARQKLPAIPKELIAQFVTGPMSAEAVNAASMAFKKAFIEPTLGARGALLLDLTLGCEPKPRAYWIHSGPALDQLRACAARRFQS